MTTEQDSGSQHSNPYQQKVSEPVVAADANAAASPSGRLTPPIWVWVVLMFVAGMIALVRVRDVGGDHAVANILTLILSFMGCCALSLWFLFFSGYTRMFRLCGLVGVISIIALFFAVFKIEHVSGEMVPKFRARWAPPPDSLLDTSAEIAASDEIDVMTTSDQDFPQFLGPRRNGTIPNLQLARDWDSNPPQQLWRQAIGAGWSGFVAVNGYAFTMEQRGDEELVTCYEIASGKLLWVHSEANRHETVLGGIGPRSTPTVHDGKVYTLGPSGSLLCLEGASGDLVWADNLLTRYNVPPGEDGWAIAWGRSNSPLIVDDLVVIPVGGPKAGTHISLAAFDRLTGKLVWEAGDRQVSYASPSLAMLGDRRMIVSVNEDNVSGHDIATGKVLWQVDWPGNSARTRAHRRQVC